jgi:uncharacterized membrane protein
MMCMLAHLLQQEHDQGRHGSEDASLEQVGGELDPRQVVRVRYARGEITQEELQQMLGVLDQTEQRAVAS